LSIWPERRGIEGWGLLPFCVAVPPGGAAKRLVTGQQAVGELRDVHAAGYINFLGMAGRHRTFHTPADHLDDRARHPRAGRPCVCRCAARKIVERGNAAFR